jgi:hypothetical protein
MSGVPEYDAFGREIGEEPLKAFGAGAPAPAPPPPRPEPVVDETEAWSGPQPVAATPDPAPTPAPAPSQPQPARPRRRRRRGSARLIVVLAALGVGLYAVGNVGVKVEGGIEGIVDEFPSDTTPPTTDVTGITGDSLIRKDHFASAIATLRSSGLGRPLTMRVAPDRIDATLIAGNRLHQVRIAPGGELNELASGDAAPGRTIPYKAIDTSAPERLVKAGATKQVPARRIDYLVLSAGPPIFLGAYYKGGRIVIGDAHGHKQRVL